MPSELFAPQSPPANLLPVQFDFGAAEQAASALRDAADVLDRAARARVQDARAAERFWTGGQRGVFDRAEAAASNAAAALVRQLRDAADKLHDQAAAARAENTRRATALGAWRRDLDAARRHFLEAQAR